MRLILAFCDEGKLRRQQTRVTHQSSSEIGMLKEDVELVFRHYGWFPTRSVPPDRWVKRLESEGYTPLQGAIPILESFGGLTISPPADKSNLFFPAPFTFDPLQAASGEFDRIEGWQQKLNTKLFPIAGGPQGKIIMFAENGSIINGWMRNLDLLGNTIEDAFELLVFARSYPVRLHGTKPWWQDSGGKS